MSMFGLERLDKLFDLPEELKAQTNVTKPSPMSSQFFDGFNPLCYQEFQDLSKGETSSETVVLNCCNSIYKDFLGGMFPS